VARFQLQRQAQKDKSGALSEHLVTLLDPAAVASEAYRSLRTSLLYAVVDAPPKVVLVTSPSSADGKSTTCANLAVVLAQAGKETLVIDGDLREPSLHKIFGVPNGSGVVNVLSGEHNLSEVWKEPLPGLKIVSTGPMPPYPAELLSSGRFAEFVGQARRLFDYVLIDSPPTDLVSDPMIIATQADAVLLVLDSQKTSKGALRKAMRNLEAVGANVLGTVMNKSTEAETGRYGYSY
jgi:capsular exopolysaccharide synthesis family protein